jgi:hypothetical protein
MIEHDDSDPNCCHNSCATDLASQSSQSQRSRRMTRSGAPERLSESIRVENEVFNLKIANLSQLALTFGPEEDGMGERTRPKTGT